MLAEQFNMEQDTETKLVGMGMAFLSRLAQQKLGHPPKPTQPGLVHKYTSSDSTLDKIAIIEGVIENTNPLAVTSFASKTG